MRAVIDRTAIDWDAVRQSMQTAETALAHAIQPDSPEIREIFERRARQLAERRSRSRESAAPRQLLVFRVGTDRLALDLSNVVEVGLLKRVTPVSGATPEMCGVFAHRGAVRSVFDMEQLLGRPQIQGAQTGYFMHIRGTAGDAVVRVNELEGVVNIESAKVRAAAQKDTSLGNLMLGVTSDGITILGADLTLARVGASRNVSDETRRVGHISKETES